jgi:hypothetical protein
MHVPKPKKQKNNGHPFPSGHPGNTAQNNWRRKQFGLNFPGRFHALRSSGLALQLRDKRTEK